MQCSLTHSLFWVPFVSGNGMSASCESCVLQSVDQSDLYTIPHLQINTHGQQELTQAGTTYNKWQFTIKMARAYLTAAAHGSYFHMRPSCCVQSGIHLPGLSQMVILQSWLINTSSPSHIQELSKPSAARGSSITFVSFYCCCLSKGACIESNFPPSCSQMIVNDVTWRW